MSPIPDRNGDAAEGVAQVRNRTYPHFSSVLLLAALVWQCAAALRPTDWVCQMLTADDTYLALQVASRWAQHGFPTFDGLHPTNGFQALWGLILRGLAESTTDHVALLRLALIAAALLNTASGLLLMRLVRSIGGTLAVAWVVGLWTMYSVSGRPALIGLENAITGAVTAGLLLAFRRLLDRPQARARWIAVATLLGLLVWARLDCAVPAAVAVLGLTWLAQRTSAWRTFILSVVLIAALAALLAGFNWWAGGTPTPVSGLAKRLVAARLEPAWTPTVLARAVLDSARMLVKASAASVGVLWPRALSSLVRVAILVLFALLIWRRSLVVGGWVWLWLTALAAHVLAFRLWLSSYYVDTLWYYGPEYVSMCVWMGCACAVATGNVSPRLRPSAWPAGLTLARVSLAVGMLFYSPTTETASRNRLNAAAWLREHVPADDRVAAWNAGELAYFSGRTLINLDGLVNDRSYLERLRAGLPVEPYLDEQQVTWIADYARNLAWLPRDRWQQVATFGDDPRLRQLVLSRRPQAEASPSWGADR